MASERPLNRALGLGGLSVYGVGMILGAGIYSVIGAAAGSAGYGLWLAFLTGAVVALLTGLSYAELSTAYPKAGAEYEYVRRASPRRREIATVIGLVMVVAGSGTAATVSLAFAGYLSLLIDVPQAVAALGLVAAITAINLVGLRMSSGVNLVLTLVEVSGLALVIALGAGDADFGRRALEVSPSGALAGAAVLFFAYLGFENVVTLAEESREPERDLSRAILVSIAVTTVLYTLVALAVVALLPPDELARSGAPLADAAGAADPRFATALGVVALFATANTGLIAILSSARVLFALARDRELPGAVAAVGRRRVPWLATLLVAAVAVPLVLIGDVRAVAGISSFAALVAFAAVNLSVVVLRFADPGRRRPFRVPLAVGRVAVLPVLGLASCGLFLARFGPTVYLVGGLVVAASITVVVVERVRARPR